MPGGSGPLDYMAYAEDLLHVSALALDEIPLADPTLAGAPERRFVSPGEPVWDCCEQLIVTGTLVSQKFTRPSSPPGAPGQRHRYGAWLWEVVLERAG